MTLHVVTPGALTTVQDLGRQGFRRHGIGPGGAMDSLSLRIANLLVGNSHDAAGLEFTFLGPTLRFPHGCWVAVAGAAFELTVTDGDGQQTSVPVGHLLWIPANATLTCGAATAGCRGYLAVAGGIAVPMVLGGRGTDIRSGFGGWHGRPLRAGDAIPCGRSTSQTLAEASPMTPPPDRGRVKVDPRSASRKLLPRPTGLIRLIPGPEYDWLSASSLQRLVRQAFTVTPDSDRMGCRIAGPTLAGIEERMAGMVSQPVSSGTVQVPPSGQPIILLADHPTTGGYPRIGHVASIDLPALGQARPGDTLQFQITAIPEAHALLFERESALERFRHGLLRGGLR